VLHFFLYFFFVLCFSSWRRKSNHEFSELSRSGTFGNWQLYSLRHFEQLSFFTRLHLTSLSKVITISSFVTLIFGNTKSVSILFDVRTPTSNIHKNKIPQKNMDQK